MTDHPFDDPRDGAALDREIERALAVEPSPEFVARVRTRVASEGAPRRGYSAWWVLLAGSGAVAAAVLVAAYIELNPSREPPPDRPADVARSTPVQTDGQQSLPPAQTDVPKVASHDSGERPPGGGSSLQPDARGVSGGRAQVVATIARTDLNAFPEVMVSAAEVAGLRQLLAMARTGIEVVAAPDPPAPSGTENMSDIVIEPIKIAPIELVRLGEAE